MKGVMMVEETVINLVGSLGFPIFTAIYFMTRIEKHLQQSNKLMAILAERLGEGDKLDV
jgi:hypothetical protein